MWVTHDGKKNNINITEFYSYRRRLGQPINEIEYSFLSGRAFARCRVATKTKEDKRKNKTAPNLKEKLKPKQEDFITSPLGVSTVKRLKRFIDRFGA